MFVFGVFWPKMNCVKQLVSQFCLNTSLHGYKFIVLPKRVLLERCLWAILSASALVFAIILSLEAWNNFQEDPTITLTDSTHHPIWNFHFPAVTLCNINKISAKKAWSLVRNLSLPKTISIKPEELHKELRLLNQLIYPENVNLPLDRLHRLQEILDFNNINIDELFYKISADCEMVSCKWKGEDKRCGSIFEKIRTTAGYCCSFNYFAYKNHTFKGDSPLKAPTKPRRVSACGYRTALEIIFDNNISDYHAALIPTYGYKAIVHHPHEIPDWSAKFMLLREKSITFLSSTPSLVYATEELKRMDYRHRRCKYTEEAPLKMFAKYTFHNCVTECRMNLFLKFCNCLPFFYFSDELISNKSLNVCDLKDVLCIQENKQSILISFIGAHMDRSLLPHLNFTQDVELCSHCYQSCEYTDYPFESSSGILEGNSSNEIFSSNNYASKNYTILKVYFNDLVGNKDRRDIHHNWHTLLALFGGILGLFVGFSFVSMFEIIYFFVIQLFIPPITHTKVANEPNIYFDEIVKRKHYNKNILTSRVNNLTQKY